MEIAIKLQYQPPVCYFCCFQITSMENCDIVQIGTDRFWLHHDCLDRGVDLIAAVRHNEIGSLNNSRTIRRLKESATRQRKD